MPSASVTRFNMSPDSTKISSPLTPPVATKHKTSMNTDEPAIRLVVPSFAAPSMRTSGSPTLPGV